MDGIKRPDSAVDRIRQRVEEKAARRAAAQEEAERAADRGPRRAATDPPQAEGQHERLPGVDAERPTDIPARGWKQILKRAWAENSADNMPIIGGGVAFFGFLAIFPTIIAAISLYGLFASPETVQSQVESLRGTVPEEVLSIISTQLESVATSNSGALSVGLVVSILAALFSASGGVNNLITAVNLAYDEVETRNAIKRRGLALLLTFGAIVFVLVTVSLVAVTPVVLDALNLGVLGTVLAQVVRWTLLLALMAGALAVLYRVAPDRDAPQFRWVSLGSVVVTVAWVVMSIGFSFYVSNFGSYSATYGAVAGVVVLMLWLQLTVFLVLLGAEINSETEHQTAQDTTQGDPVPMGTREATVADELPEEPTPTKESARSA
ncbi:YihY/virulence factor BrkB family protein [Klenkia sp. LSe6-5]|uniref:YihY/virulence factor BrkB family protein n=1 Tax=Klenkia sesuvii TaxID=3103137 RepID=A0ABU8DSW6_9ACTN